jgi:hypothetical protein
MPHPACPSQRVLSRTTLAISHRALALFAVLAATLLTSSIVTAHASASNGRIGALLTNNELWAKDGDFGAQWTQIATNASSFSMDGSRIGYLTTAGVPYAKDDASLTAPWNVLGPAGQKSLAVGAYPPRAMIVNPADDLYVQEGSPLAAPAGTPGGIYVAGRVGPISAADGRLAFANTDSTAMRTEEGPRSGDGAAWTFQLFGSTEIALSGNRIVTLLNNGQLWAKQGPQGATWYPLRDNVVDMAASGNRVAAIDADGKLYVMDKAAISSVTSSDWTLELAGATDVALDNDRIGAVLNNGELWLKEGGLADQWIFELNGAVKVDLSHRDVTGPSISASGPLHDAPNPLTGAALNLTLGDADSGAAGYTLSESNGTVLAQQARAVSDCPAWWCAGTPFQPSASIDPDALGWATGTHHLVLDAWDFAGNHTTQTWDVNYYKTSWDYGTWAGYNHTVDTQTEADRLSAVEDASTPSVRASLWAGLSPGEQASLPGLDPATRYADVDAGPLPWLFDDPVGSDSPVATIASGIRPTLAVAPHSWCANHITGIAGGSSNKHTYYGGTVGRRTAVYTVGLTADTYDCDNGHSRTYFAMYWDTRSLDATPTYQWQMVRRSGQLKPYTPPNGDPDMDLKKGEQFECCYIFNNLPYVEMWPMPDGTAGKVDEVRLPIGFTQSGTLAPSHVIHVPMTYVPIVQP